MGSGGSKSSGDNTTKCLEDYSPEELANGIPTLTDIVERVKKDGLDRAFLPNCKEQENIFTLQDLEITDPLTRRIISSKPDRVPRAGSMISFSDVAGCLDDGTATAASAAAKEDEQIDAAKKEQKYVEATKTNQHCIDYINDVCRNEFDGKFSNMKKTEFLVKYLKHFSVELKEEFTPGMVKSKTGYKLVDGKVASHVFGPKSFYKVYEKQKAAWSSKVDTCSTEGSHRDPTLRSTSTNDASAAAATALKP